MVNILVVNNDIDTMSLIKTWLEKRSYNVQYTSSADEALSMLKKFEPRVVLVDQMQQEVIDRIKRVQRQPIPVILMTGYSLRHAPLQALSADDVIEKPFQPDLLIRIIEKHISHDGMAAG